MSVLQAQVIESLNGLSDENLTFLLNMIDNYMKPGNMPLNENSSQQGNVIKIGMFKEEKYIADGYDFDHDNNVIAGMFEDI